MAKNTEPFPEEGTPEYEAMIAGAGAEVAKQSEGRSLNIHSATGTETAVSLETLRQMSFGQLSEAFGFAPASDVLGSDQFGPILEDKGRLCGVPLVIVHWIFNDGENGSFVTMFIMDKDENRYIVNDGSTGIRDQLAKITDNEGINGGLACPHGFRVSNYFYTDKEGKERPAKTFYIDTKL